MSKIRAFLAGEIVLFVCASLLHRGILAHGFEHSKAAIAESVIAVVLAIGFAVCVYRSFKAASAALAVQAFALSGVAIGVVMILIGVGPRSALDFGIHGVMAVTLALGIVAARRMMTRNIAP
jgi:hypothetical protein